jgi:tetratricopeptide (TPR) repeat protein
MAPTPSRPTYAPSPPLALSRVVSGRVLRAHSAALPRGSQFDSLPEAERGPMLELFEKTFPAFLAQELADSSLEAENELFRHAVESGALRGEGGGRPVGEEVVEAVTRLNAEAVDAFNAERYALAADALSRAIALDPSNASLYGNRALAQERRAKHEEALLDAESALGCDPAYVPAYERKANALLALSRARPPCPPRPPRHRPSLSSS